MTAMCAVKSHLDLPPPYTLLMPEADDALAYACSLGDHAVAGTLVWAGRRDLVDFAVVLEPEEPLFLARRVFLLGMNALGDAVASNSPPEKTISFDWADTMRYDGARLGWGRLGLPQDCGEENIPSWLVFSGTLCASSSADPGLTPDATSLDEEGFLPDSHRSLIESFSRHLMRLFDLWADRGFLAAAEAYLSRLVARESSEGARLAENGDVLLARLGQSAVERLSLAASLSERGSRATTARTPLP